MIYILNLYYFLFWFEWLSIEVFSYVCVCLCVFVPWVFGQVVADWTDFIKKGIKVITVEKINIKIKEEIWC